MFSIKGFLKKYSPVALSKNHYYDRVTKKIIKRTCHSKSSCIDVGCHKGEILDIFLKKSPLGKHFAFEPVPYLYKQLKKKYSKNENCYIYSYALSNSEGLSSFNHVISNPSYSGLLKRKYDRRQEKDESIIVEKKTMDSVIPSGHKIDFIKIDTEGGDFDVLLGAVETIKKNFPVIIIEFGAGGSDVYGASPDKLFTFLKDIDYQICVLSKKPVILTADTLKTEYNKGKNYCFILFPNKYNSITNNLPAPQQTLQEHLQTRPGMR